MPSCNGCRAWLVLRRRQLVQMLSAERQRMRISHAAARPSIDRVIEPSCVSSRTATPTSSLTHVQRHHA